LGRSEETVLGWWKTQPIEIGALILGRIKIQAEEYLDEPIEDAVIAIPAHFDINQRWAVKPAIPQQFPLVREESVHPVARG
jgi:molecular chaperone DnaK (HSP70)